MTREEAINELKLVRESAVPWQDPYLLEAIDMAIEALHREEAEEKGYCHRIRPSNVEVVVRCKDCRYCTEYYDRDGYPYWECAEWDGGTDADGYCHYGERREE